MIHAINVLISFGAAVFFLYKEETAMALTCLALANTHHILFKLEKE